MRVLMLSTSFPVPNNEISGIFIRHLVTHFSEELDVTVLIPCPSHPIHQDDKATYSLECFRYAPMAWQVLAHEPGGLPVALKTQRKALLLLPVFFASMLIACLRLARHVDLIHANWAFNGAVAGMAGVLLRKPVVTTLRGSDVQRLHHSPVDRWLLDFCCATNTKIICVSTAIQEQVARMFPRWSQKIVTIPNGIGHSFFSIGPRQRPASSVLRITSIGSLIKRKGMHILLEAAAIVKERRKIHVSIIGDGPEIYALQHQCFHLGLSDVVKIHGHIPQHDIPGCLFQTDIFVLASFSEGRPNVLLEAMAAGVAVIASDIDGVREMISHGKNGLLFEVGKPELLAEQLETLCQDQARRTEIGRAGRESLQEHGLSWSDTAKRYTTLYKDVLECAE